MNRVKIMSKEPRLLRNEWFVYMAKMHYLFEPNKDMFTNKSYILCFAMVREMRHVQNSAFVN